MRPDNNRDDLRPEYDFDYSKAVRGIYCKQLLKERANVVVLEPAVAQLQPARRRRKSWQRQKEGVNGMPTISMFYGILIRMFFRDVEKQRS